jgi:dolichol-phosphate mannosyltransferase
MKRVILTGATGFVGANLARALLRAGHDVHLLIRGTDDHWRLRDIRSDVAIHQVDLADSPAVSAVVASVQPEWVFHLAVYGAYSIQTNAHRMVETNLMGTINLVEACAQTGCDAFVNTGSSSEYGFTAQAAVETDRLVPNSTYAVTKAAATHYCHYVAQRDKLNLSTLRLYSVYGPYEDPGRLMPKLVMSGRQGALPPLVSPDIARDFVYVTDACSAYLLSAQDRGGQPGEIYNIGSGVQISLRALVDLARSLFSIEAEPAWSTMANRDWDSTVWVADPSKAYEKLGWRPAVNVLQGLECFSDWLTDHPELEARYLSALESSR